jgi:hypothetical protein
MKNPVISSDPDIRGSWPALLRAAKAARRLSIETGTPFYVFKDGKVVDLNRGRKKRRKTVGR